MLKNPSMLQKYVLSKVSKSKGKTPIEIILTFDQKGALATDNPISKSTVGPGYTRYNVVLTIINEDETLSLDKNERQQDFFEVPSPEANPTKD